MSASATLAALAIAAGIVLALLTDGAAWKWWLEIRR